jgi:hypothetical protein
MKRKKCTRCGKTRLIKFYTPRKNRTHHYTGFHSWCKACIVDDKNERYANMTDKEAFECYIIRKKWYYKKYYKITFEEYIKKVEQQNYLCAICKLVEHYETHTLKGFKNNVLARREKNGSHLDNCGLYVDHDHETDEVRDLLCNDCNRAYGFARENPQTIKGMLDYSKKWRIAA